MISFCYLISMMGAGNKRKLFSLREYVFIMKSFKDKTEAFHYIKNKFSNRSKVILVRGSTANGPIREFSDIDVEVYYDTLEKPYYELCFVGLKLVLISVYFYNYTRGKRIKHEKNVRVLYGKYNENLKPDFSKEEYTLEQSVKRECQMVVDSLFKYIRHKNKVDLERVQKRI